MWKEVPKQYRTSGGRRPSLAFRKTRRKDGGFNGYLTIPIDMVKGERMRVMVSEDGLVRLVFGNEGTKVSRNGKRSGIVGVPATLIRSLSDADMGRPLIAREDGDDGLVVELSDATRKRLAEAYREW